MLDGNNPEIRVDEIMQRIQEKVRARRLAGGTDGVQIVRNDASLPGISGVEEVFVRARASADAGATVPPMSRLRGPARAFAEPIAKIFLRLAQIITRDQRAFNHAALELLRSLSDQLARTGSETVALRRELAALRSELPPIQADGSQTRATVAELQARAEQTATTVARLTTSVSLQERRLISFLERGELPERNAEAVDRGEPDVLEGTYLGFEDEFRGSREEIRTRLAVYLPQLRAAQAATGKAPVLDVGCGRGELLEILRSDGIAASGVDVNRAAVEQCNKLGLDATLGDAFHKLRDTPDASLGGLTAIHLVEHLPYALVLRLIDEALRVLRPGGVAIFETPNPRNVLVGSCNFYVDPTHRNPVHPRTLQYLCEARGMVRAETMLLHPYPTAMHVPDGDSVLARRFNEYFYGPQDYAVLGHRP